VLLTYPLPNHDRSGMASAMDAGLVSKDLTSLGQDDYSPLSVGWLDYMHFSYYAYQCHA